MTEIENLQKEIADLKDRVATLEDVRDKSAGIYKRLGEALKELSIADQIRGQEIEEKIEGLYVGNELLYDQIQDLAQLLTNLSNYSRQVDNKGTGNLPS